jgi:coenzyme PQQ biosynthesis protein PqqD
MLMVPESVLRLNNTAQAILSLCDGTRTVAEISKALKFSYSNAPEEVIERGVLDLLFALRERGAVTF